VNSGRLADEVLVKLRRYIAAISPLGELRYQKSFSHSEAFNHGQICVYADRGNEKMHRTLFVDCNRISFEGVRNARHSSALSSTSMTESIPAAAG